MKYVKIPLRDTLKDNLYIFLLKSANLRGRREVNKKLADIHDSERKRISMIEAKTEDHTRFLIQEYLFNRTNAME